MSASSSDSDRMPLDIRQERHDALTRAVVEAGKRLANDEEFHDHFWTHTLKRIGDALSDWITRWVGSKIIALLLGGLFMTGLWLAVTKGWIKP